MGKCIKCGKETANEYSYYSGDYAGQSEHYQSNMKVTTTSYSNIAAHSGFVCTRCVREWWETIGWFIIGGVGYLFVIFLIWALFTNNPPPLFLIITFFV